MFKIENPRTVLYMIILFSSFLINEILKIKIK